MRRNTLVCIGTLVLALCCALSAAIAQSPARVPRIGFLTLGTPDPSGSSPTLEAFRQGLRELGYEEDQNIAIEPRFARASLERLQESAAELVRLPVDIILAVGDQTIRVAKDATTTIPIVMAPSGDPVGTGLVASLARPGGNVTGLATISTELGAKRLELLRKAFPGLSRVAALWDPTDPAKAAEFRGIQVAVQALGLQLVSLQVRSPADFEGAFEAASREGADALITLGNPLTIAHRTRIVELVAKSQLPAIYSLREFVDVGGLMSYGPSFPDLLRRAAYYVDRILKGAKPGDLPVEQPMKFELVINLRAAKTLGLTLPPTLLFLADAVIR